MTDIQTTEKGVTPYDSYRAALMTADYAPEAKETLNWLLDTAQEEDWTLSQISAHVGVSKSVMQRVLSAEYDSPADNTVIQVSLFRDKWEAEKGVVKIPFVETAVAKLVWQAVDYSVSYQEIVSIIGNSQWGKTKAVEEYCRRRGAGKGRVKPLMLRMPVHPSPGTVLGDLAAQLGISPNHNGFARLVTQVKNRLTRWNVVIVDECHQLLPMSLRSSKTIELLREIFDYCQCGMVLVGTNVWGNALDGIGGGAEKWKALLGQTVLRGITVQIPADLLGRDKKRLWRAFGFSAPDNSRVGQAAMKTVDELVRVYGLGRYVRRLRAAATAAKRAGVAPSWEYFLAANKQLTNLMQGILPGDQDDDDE